MSTAHTQLVRVKEGQKVALPALYAPAPEMGKRAVEFFTAHIRNPNTRKAYFKAVGEFAAWCERRGIGDLAQVETIMVAAYIEELQMRLAAPSVKQHLAAIRMLSDWLIVGGLLRVNPASAVRGPKHVVKKGKTPVLSAEETRTLLDSIDASTLIGLRDRALIALLIYTFARVGAAIKMKVEDVYVQGRRTWVRLREKGGKRHEMPFHHTLDEYLTGYIEGAQLSSDRKGMLFRSVFGKTRQLTENGVAQVDVYRMIRRRADDAGIRTKTGCHTIRATRIAEYLRNRGKFEIAQQMANHESARTTGFIIAGTIK